MTNMQKRHTLCWSCKRATGSCPWSEANRQRPVKGWVAEEVVIKCAKDLNMKSYIVMECPLFVRDSYRDGQIRMRDVQ